MNSKLSPKICTESTDVKSKYLTTYDTPLSDKTPSSGVPQIRIRDITGGFYFKREKRGQEIVVNLIFFGQKWLLQYNCDSKIYRNYLSTE